MQDTSATGHALDLLDQTHLVEVVGVVEDVGLELIFYAIIFPENLIHFDLFDLGED